MHITNNIYKRITIEFLKCMYGIDIINFRYTDGLKYVSYNENIVPSFLDTLMVLDMYSLLET